jgi:hypothetical protein
MMWRNISQPLPCAKKYHKGNNVKIQSYICNFVFVAFFSTAANAQSIEIFVTNNNTGEKKTYEVKNNTLSIPVNFVKGWNKCTANAIKKFQFNGVDTVRGELFCVTEKNTTMGISCVATKNNAEVTIANIYDATFKLIDKENIGANSSAEITLACVNY